MTRLFKRRAIVEIDTLRIEGLDVQFTVRHENANFGKAEISIFNLNRTHRNQIAQQAAATTTLLVGYQNSALELLFRGTMREAFSHHDNTDWVTTLRTGDGDKAPKARINKGYRPKTPKSLVWQDLVSALQEVGIGVGNAIDDFDLAEFKDGLSELLRGGSFQGDAMTQIRKLARSANLDVQIQDQELVVTQIGTPLDAQAILLAPRSGLVGSPKKGAKGELLVKSLIIPGLRPKRLVKIESPTESGIFVIKSAKYKGDTSGQDWYAELECVER
jgi:hypothetical protein